MIHGCPVLTRFGVWMPLYAKKGGTVEASGDNFLFLGREVNPVN